MSKKNLLSLIKPPSCKKPKSPSPLPQARIRRLAENISEILKTHQSWDEVLETQFAQDPEIAVSDVLDRIRDVKLGLMLFIWAFRRNDGSANASTYSALLKILARSSEFQEIESVLKTMKSENKTPSREAFDALIIAFSRAGSAEKAHELYSVVKETHRCLPSIIASNSLLSALIAYGQIHIACQGQERTWDKFRRAT
ncbi:pentatricopeptide repeat-containing protein At2g01390-like [Magnolia sinica]|uniref:pentatricopeptide repeat-containing protein At2g01390-like n=1 Tax=Magnolia sinica TaxID=86752 RepID=UPI00265B0430|nr:pentatricopeptide repeat-containing protein At2g01390-like [Magnolia sinica]XP_058074477.1 pentatricopeptide repeat-containing protein At2g01390-like [Magnolia sinica]XP_058074478.1 pentatricopeptide repeat-containing protein At2g01390-like [Magnolia sinica]XP_058074479.1 pentatricopeptide repeat-containing protein At2g01390-like [Magnolia sinica]XP_058074480.1 pentatricopeptide repeat-containing protein At2g01390-like [Magnolia sinica]